MNDKILKVVFTPEGVTAADHLAKERVDTFIRQFHTGTFDYVEVADWLMIDYFRLAVLTKEIKPENLVFEFEGKLITIDETGNMSEWPKGFEGLNSQVVRCILGLRVKQRAPQ